MFNRMQIIDVKEKWLEFDTYVIHAKCRRGIIKLLLKGKSAFIDDGGKWRPLSGKIAEIISLNLAYWRIAQARNTRRSI